MSDENKDTDKDTENEVVKAMGSEMKPDVPVGLATIPKGMSASALARRTVGEILQNELEFHCASCGWSGSLKFDKDEMEALDNNIRDYSGPCPKCSTMTLSPKDLYWGNEFPSMSALAQKNKRAEARVNAEEFVDVVAEKITDMMGGTPKPTIEDPADPATAAPIDKEELPEEPDLSKLTPR